MKKFLSILLSISMVLGLLTSTAYANNASTKHSATKFESIGHGEFRIAPSNSIASDEVEDVEIGKVIIFVGLGIGCLFLGAVFTVIASKKLVKK